MSEREKQVVESLSRSVKAQEAVLDLAVEWRKVMKPCGIPNCESPTCQLIYAVDELVAAAGDSREGTSDGGE